MTFIELHRLREGWPLYASSDHDELGRRRVTFISESGAGERGHGPARLNRIAAAVREVNDNAGRISHF